MPMVASSGAMRTEFCSGRRPNRSMISPDQRRHHRDQDDGERQRRMQLHHRDPADIGADEIDRALRKVDQPADAEDQREPDCNEGVDIADDQPVDRVVEPGRHASPRVERQAGAPLRPSCQVGLPSQSANWPLRTTSSAFMAPLTRRLCDVERRGAEDDARDVLDLGEGVADRLAVGAADLHHGGAMFIAS